MMQFLHTRIDNLITKIDTYDKKNWDIYYQNYKLKSTNGEAAKIPKNRRRRLIDLDLFRGKPFQKAKCSYNFYHVIFFGILRTLFFPFQTSWWRGHFDPDILILYLTHYFFEITIIILYFFEAQLQENSFVSFSSIIISLIVSQIYIHMTSRNVIRASSDTEIENIKIEKTNSLECINKKNNSYLRVRKRKEPLFQNQDPDWDSVTDEGDKREKNGQIFSEQELPEQFEHQASELDSGSEVSDVSYSVLTTDMKDSDFQVCSDQPSIKESCVINYRGHIQEEVAVTYFSGKTFKTVKISIWEIVDIIKERVSLEVDNPKCQKSLWPYLFITIYFGILPYLYTIATQPFSEEISKYFLFNILIKTISWFRENSIIIIFHMILVIVTRMSMVLSFFILYLVGEKTFKIRIMYAKYFCALTSSRRAKRHQLPHFRLNKSKNIKAWLSLRSYLRKCGPVQSVDFIITSTLYLSSFFILLFCIKYLLYMNMLKEDANLINDYTNWEIFSWAILLSSLLIRFLSFQKELNSRYDNNTELLTEQINLYFQLEADPSKKPDLLIANNVLKLASKLLKEVEAPKKVTRNVMNPILRNIFRVVILSLISGVLSEVFGISFKFWKLKT